jgi:hypothetical protein
MMKEGTGTVFVKKSKLGVKGGMKPRKGRKEQSVWGSEKRRKQGRYDLGFLYL